MSKKIGVVRRGDDAVSIKVSTSDDGIELLAETNDQHVQLAFTISPDQSEKLRELLEDAEEDFEED